MAIQINGIQQLGVGVENTEESFAWFRRNFGVDIEVVNEKAMAEYMLPYTGGQPCKRHTVLAMNLQGGGGFEIWQHAGRKPLKPNFEVQLGDLGISVGKLKTTDIEKTYRIFRDKGLKMLTEITKDPSGKPHFFMMDLSENCWEFVQYSEFFVKTKAVNGGVFGAIIGVKDIEESMVIYRDILNYDTVIYDQTAIFPDLAGVPGGNNQYRRVLLKHSDKKSGPFSPIFGSSEIELVQVLDRTPEVIYDGRMWGDPGFIHLCFDIHGMDEIREFVKSKGFPFTVDSAEKIDTFDMGDAAGNFAYIQAPEGTLIEFVETLKVPIMQKWGIFIDLKKRPAEKPLPRWLLKLFGTKRIKD
ncbi:MAG TPA: VOC family protein [Prolixibacteraceae bacterium]|nr:VOC family protein [Prolixibacteraceae bacterium]